MNNHTMSCLDPARLPSIGDYEGPLKKTAGIFAPARERQSAQPPRYRPGAKLCFSDFFEKLHLFLRIQRIR
jgi:hypothetical protein